MPHLDLTDATFGRLLVLEELPRKGQHRYWLCKCECGKIREVGQSNLRSGKSTSCGCYATELAGSTYKSKFEKHGDHKTRLYGIHRSMLNRCTKEWDCNYSRYGAIGIQVVPEWLDYETFKEWALAEGYDDTLTLDRLDSTSHYSPNNCRWATYETQTRNRRKQAKPASSRFIGVSREADAHKWRASVCVSGKPHRLGTFDDEVSAAIARDQYIKEQGLLHFKLNF